MTSKRSTTSDMMVFLQQASLGLAHIEDGVLSLTQRLCRNCERNLVMGDNRASTDKVPASTAAATSVNDDAAGAARANVDVKSEDAAKPQVRESLRTKPEYPQRNEQDGDGPEPIISNANVATTKLDVDSDRLSPLLPPSKPLPPPPTTTTPPLPPPPASPSPTPPPPPPPAKLSKLTQTEDSMDSSKTNASIKSQDGDGGGGDDDDELEPGEIPDDSPADASLSVNELLLCTLQHFCRCMNVNLEAEVTASRHQQQQQQQQRRQQKQRKDVRIMEKIVESVRAEVKRLKLELLRELKQGCELMEKRKAAKKRNNKKMKNLEKSDRSSAESRRPTSLPPAGSKVLFSVGNLPPGADIEGIVTAFATFGIINFDLTEITSAARVDEGGFVGGTAIIAFNVDGADDEKLERLLVHNPPVYYPGLSAPWTPTKLLVAFEAAV